MEELSGDECISCPHCGEEATCKHVILFWSACNCDWSGDLADETNSVDSDLRNALWAAIKAGGDDAVAPGKWSYELQTLFEAARDAGLNDGGPEDCDWWYAIREYWRGVIQSSAGAIEIEYGFDGGFPGGSDTYGVVFASRPKATIPALIRTCKRDIELLNKFAAAPVETRPAGKTKGRSGR